MPNYHYKCCKCHVITEHFLPISTDPKEPMACECGYTSHRVIGRPQFPDKVGKVFAGDWFKKTYGHDIAEPYEDKARQHKDYEDLKKELDKEKGC